MKAIKKPVRSEHTEQCHVFLWANTEIVRHPELEFLFAVPNGAYKSPAARAKFQREGLKPGVPDLFLPVPNGMFHGLFIEMKRVSGSNLHNPDQVRFQDFLRSQGYCVVVCRGQDEAVAAIEEYLKTKTREDAP